MGKIKIICKIDQITCIMLQIMYTKGNPPTWAGQTKYICRAHPLHSSNKQFQYKSWIIVIIVLRSSNYFYSVATHGGMSCVWVHGQLPSKNSWMPIIRLVHLLVHIHWIFMFLDSLLHRLLLWHWNSMLPMWAH